MEKNDLKSLVTQMYENLLENIDNQDGANKTQVVNFLKDAVDIVSNIPDHKIDSIEHAKEAFNNAYKDIANKSISSYEHTNKTFETLTKMHKETLSCCSGTTIDIPSITDKFNDIQSHMLDEVKKANQIITQLSTQVENLERDSNLDSLTKVFNRRALSTYLTSVSAQKDLKHELHLLILDVDDFKKINDTYGHIAGDKILIFIANILKRTLRDGDKIFRYGGEEFVIILNRIDAEHCKKITNRIINIVNDNKLIYKGENLSVTVSVGATKYVNSDSPDTLIGRADKGLYKAKISGKNKLVVEIPSGC